MSSTKEDINNNFDSLLKNIIFPKCSKNENHSIIQYFCVNTQCEATSWFDFLCDEC